MLDPLTGSIPEQTDVISATTPAGSEPREQPDDRSIPVFEVAFGPKTQPTLMRVEVVLR